MSEQPGKPRGFPKEEMPKLTPEGMEEWSRQRKQYMQRLCGGREHVQGAARNRHGYGAKSKGNE